MLLPPRIIRIFWQVSSSSEIFAIGSLLWVCVPPIRGNFTAAHVDHGTMGPVYGSDKVERSQNGRHLDRVRSYGFMENASCYPTVALSQTLMVSHFVAGSGKTVLWYVDRSIPLS